VKAYIRLKNLNVHRYLFVEDVYLKTRFEGFWMTSISGIVCKDGIVIVGNKKVKAGEMTYYEDKIVSVEKYENLVVDAAGFLDIREKFIQDVRNLHVLEKKEIVKRDPSRGFVGLTEDSSLHRFSFLQFNFHQATPSESPQYGPCAF
jgi:hypothetical protein